LIRKNNRDRLSISPDSQASAKITATRFFNVSRSRTAFSTHLCLLQLGYDVEKIYLTSMALEQALIETIRELSPQQQQAVLNFARSLKQEFTEKDELSELLAKITPENLHGEIDFGYAVGQEIG